MESWRFLWQYLYWNRKSEWRLWHSLQTVIPRSQTDGTSFSTKRTREENFICKKWQKCFSRAGVGISGTLCLQKQPDLHREEWVLFTCRQSSNAKWKQLWGREECLYHKVLKTKLIGAGRSYWVWPVKKAGLILRHPYRKRKGVWDHRGFCAFCECHSTCGGRKFGIWNWQQGWAWQEQNRAISGSTCVTRTLGLSRWLK